MSITTQQGELALALQWSKYEDGFPKPHKAVASVSFIAQPADADTLTIAGVARRYKNTPAAEGDIKIGATLKATIDNTIASIYGTGGSGYYADTLPILAVDAEAGYHTLFLTAFFTGVGGNSLTLAQSGTGVSTRYTLSGSVFSGGLSGGAARNAWGRIGIAEMPLNTETLVVGGTTYTFSTSSNSGNNIDIALTGQDSILGLALTIADRLATNADVTNISRIGVVVSFQTTTAGTAGNSVVLSETVVDATAVIVTGAGTFLGGLVSTEFDVDSLTYYRMRVRETDYGDGQMQDTIPLEIGSTMTPTGAYKQGTNAMGGATFMPRFENSLGLILLAALGKDTKTNPSTGVYLHDFTFQTNEINIPWLSARVMIPGRDDVFGNGIIGYDNKVNLLRIVISAAAPLEATMQLMGRVPVMDNHPEVWAGQSFEDFTSIGLACKGSFTLPTIADLPAPMPVTQVIVEIANAVTTPRDEMIVGSYFPDDVVPRARVMTIRFIYKWPKATLKQYLFGNTANATAWSPTPFVTTTSGNTLAADIVAQAPNNIVDTDTPYQLEIQANQVFWQPQPMRMRAGDIVMMEVIGTALFSADGYAHFLLTNGISDTYAVPAEP